MYPAKRIFPVWQIIVWSTARNRHGPPENIIPKDGQASTKTLSGPIIAADRFGVFQFHNMRAFSSTPEKTVESQNHERVVSRNGFTWNLLVI